MDSRKGKVVDVKRLGRSLALAIATFGSLSGCSQPEPLPGNFSPAAQHFSLSQRKVLDASIRVVESKLKSGDLIGARDELVSARKLSLKISGLDDSTSSLLRGFDVVLTEMVGFVMDLENTRMEAKLDLARFKARFKEGAPSVDIVLSLDKRAGTLVFKVRNLSRSNMAFFNTDLFYNDPYIYAEIQGAIRSLAQDSKILIGEWVLEMKQSTSVELPPLEPERTRASLSDEAARRAIDLLEGHMSELEEAWK